MAVDTINYLQNDSVVYQRLIHSFMSFLQTYYIYPPLVLIWLRSHGIEPALWVMSPTCCHHTRPHLFFIYLDSLKHDGFMILVNNLCAKDPSENRCYFAPYPFTHGQITKLQARCEWMNIIHITVRYSDVGGFFCIRNLRYCTFYKVWNLTRHFLFIKFGALDRNQTCDANVPS